jgi:DNA polymerase I-like protein with 3'-5' exonuclease and polymerase domains
MRVDRDAIFPRFEKTRRGREGLDTVIDEQVKATGFLEYEKRGGEIWHPTCKSCRNGAKKRVGCEACGGRGKLDPVPMTFNPGSWQQRGRFLYDHIGIPKRRFAGNVQAWQVERGYYDEDEVAGATDSLAMLQAQHLHPIIPTFLTRSKLAKDEGFLAKWWEMSKVDSRLHSEFANTTVASGRLSSRDPNLMQVTMRFRDLFVPDEDCELVPGDMSQLELVVAAYMSRDPVMIEIIRQGWDMHRITAEAIYSVPWRDVPKDSSMRAVSKVANFLSNYGGQKRKLQEGIEKDALSKPELGIVVPDLAECSRILMAHKRKYVGYWAWVERTKARTRALGYAETAFGRPRFFPDINSDNDEYRSEAERAAVNHAIQGTAADLMKMAMVNISRDKLMNEWGYMVLQVHDEIVSVVQKNYVAAYSERLKTHMELAQPFEPVVPLRAEVTHGMTWQGAHK